MHFRRGCIWIILSVSIWPNVESCTNESKSAGICLHTYLERDFPAIEMIVYPHRNNRSQSHTRSRYGKQLFSDGQELMSNCHTLNETLQCFSEVTDECYYYEDLYEHEKLLHGLTNVFKWICKDIQTIRQNFLVLLQSIDCLETERINGKCSEPKIPPNVWTKILRHEVNSTICPLLLKQRNCLHLGRRFGESCGHQATDIYHNMSNIFLESWCNKTSKGSEISIAFLVFSLSSIIYFNLQY